MKRVLLGLVALVMVVSGVAAVSAYEAHVVNVKAHVENAMTLIDVGGGPLYKMEFGTVFPEEWLTKTFKVSMSGSFCSYDNHQEIDYDIWVVEKPILDGSGNPTGNFYPWLGDALYIGIDTIGAGFIKYPDDAVPPKGPGHLKHVGYTVPTGPVATGHLNKPAPQHQSVTVGLDVPVFRKYYNALTDPEPKPSGRLDPTVIIEPEDTARYHPDGGVTLGAEIKVQITKIYRSAWTPYP